MIFPLTRRLRAPAAALLTTAALLMACGVTHAATPVATLAEAPDDLLKEANEHDLKLEAKQALDCYCQLEKLQPQNADILVAMARQYRHLMADASSESDKLKLGNLALEYGKRAAAIAPNNSDAQLSCAISYGKMIPLLPKREQVSSSKLIKEGAERAIKLDAQNDLAWHILGRWNRNVASVGTMTRALAAMIYEKLPPASNEEAVNCLQRAIKINPNRLMHYIELGKTYAQMGKKDEAQRYIKKGLSMPSIDKDDPDAKETGRQVLATIR